MNKVRRVLILGVMVSLLAALAVVPVTAQDECCQGGTLIEGNFGGQDVQHTLILLANDTASTRVAGLMYPGFLGTDPSQAVIAPDQPGSIVASWDVSEDGTTYTFHLRDDFAWSDGTPITSADVLYSWEAIKAGADGLNSSPFTFIIDPTGASGILDVTAPDDSTVVVTFANAECTALSSAALLYPAPRQVLPADVATLDDTSEDLGPTVTQGVFNFGEFRPGEQVSLIANPDYPDALEGGVQPTGYIYKNVPDQNVLTEQFLAGETNMIDGPPVARRADIRGTDAQYYDYPGNAWDYLAFNLADPSNPQSAFDESGNPIDQGHHPIFGDVRVRQALSKAVDVDAIIQAALFGEGTRMTSFIIPASWAYATDLAPISFDAEAAGQMLTEAGWVDDDNDPATPRVAQGALYAEDGTPFTFTLYTNEGNTRREAIGTLVQDELAQIGVQVDFQTIDFNTILDIQNSQTFDAIILGWRNGYPDDPDVTQLFTPQGDVVGNGSNFTSYNSERFNELNQQAKTLPGCDPAERTPMYVEMQQIFQQDLPYIPLAAQNGMYAVAADVEGFSPYPSQFIWNIDTWAVKTP